MELPLVREDAVDEGRHVGNVDLAVVGAIGIGGADAGGIVGEDIVDEGGDIGHIDGAVHVDVASCDCRLNVFLTIDPHVGKQVAVLDGADAVGLAGGDVHLIECCVIFPVGLPVLVGQGIPVAIVVKSHAAVVVAHPVHLGRVVLAEAGRLALDLGHVAGAGAVVADAQTGGEVKLAEV